jgi:hypothetical protein
LKWIREKKNKKKKGKRQENEREKLYDTEDQGSTPGVGPKEDIHTSIYTNTSTRMQI